MKSLVDIIQENLDGSIILTVLDKKSIKTFANNQKELKFKGADPRYLVYQVKKGVPYIFFSTDKGASEFINTTVEEDGKKQYALVRRLKVGEGVQTSDGTFWLRIAK